MSHEAYITLCVSIRHGWDLGARRWSKREQSRGQSAIVPATLVNSVLSGAMEDLYCAGFSVAHNACMKYMCIANRHDFPGVGWYIARTRM
jgi:hypothetical protein